MCNTPGARRLLTMLGLRKASAASRIAWVGLSLRSRMGWAWRVVCLCGLLGVPAAWAVCTQADRAVPWQQVAPGVWVWAPSPAQDGEADISVSNGGFVVPVSALVDGRRAWVVDPGPSLQHGQRVRRSLRCQAGAEVVGVFNTHAHAENVLGNAAFADVPRRYALAGTRVAMAARCPSCLASLTEKVGPRTMRGTLIVLPTVTLQPGETLKLGRHAVQVGVAERAHTETDLLLWHPESRWLWAGGLVYGRRVPELAQGSVMGWLGALEQMLHLRPVGVISNVVARAPDDGQPIAALQATHRYVGALRTQVWQAMDAGASPLDAGWQDMSAWRDWAGYADRQGFNALRAWRELEPVWMGSANGAPPPEAWPNAGAAPPRLFAAPEGN